MKKLIISAIIASLLIPVTAFGAYPLSTGYKGPFTDVDSSTDYNKAIQWMADNGVVEGYHGVAGFPDNSFRPDRCVIRVEMLKILFEANQTELVDASSDGHEDLFYWETWFSDVDINQWYWPYLHTALHNGIVEGYSDHTFKPYQCVSRVEAIKMAILVFNDGEIPSYNDKERLWSYSDVDKSEWYGQYIVPALFNYLVGTKHMIPIPGSFEGANFYPGDSMTRKEVAEMLYRMKAVNDHNIQEYPQDTNLEPFAL